jgi:competence protein ComEA
MFTGAASLSSAAALVVTLALAVPHATATDAAEKPRASMKSSTPVERPHPAKASSADKHHDEKVNINKADVKELMTLTGVGRKVAEKIVEYRDSHGPFKKADELRKVEGVGNGLWEKNRDRIVTK